jgi:hypothetical protein
MFYFKFLFTLAVTKSSKKIFLAAKPYYFYLLTQKTRSNILKLKAVWSKKPPRYVGFGGFLMLAMRGEHGKLSTSERISFLFLFYEKLIGISAGPRGRAKQLTFW